MKSVPADENFLVCDALKMSNKRGSLISLEGEDGFQSICFLLVIMVKPHFIFIASNSFPEIRCAIIWDLIKIAGIHNHIASILSPAQLPDEHGDRRTNWIPNTRFKN